MLPIACLQTTYILIVTCLYNTTVLNYIVKYIKCTVYNLIHTQYIPNL